jgi:anti-sigma-K factor RskA
VNNDVHTLTGAFVLDALSEMERRAFEEHMSSCAACTQEVAELRETTARLGMATATTPPPELWNRVRTATTQVRQLPPVSDDGVVIRPRRWTTRVAVFAAAASVLAAVGIGIGWYATNSQLKDDLATSQTEIDKLHSVLSAPDVKSSSATVGNANVTAVISRSRDEMVVLVKGLPALPADHVYQAWFVTPENKVTSAGLLAGTSGSMTADDLTAARGANALALTVEPSGGSPTPTTLPPVAAVALPA